MSPSTQHDTMAPKAPVVSQFDAAAGLVPAPFPRRFSHFGRTQGPCLHPTDTPPKPMRAIQWPGLCSVTNRVNAEDFP